MINIFGKLYTFLRRPQQQNGTAESTQQDNGAVSDDGRQGLTDSVQSTDWVHVKPEMDHDTSGTDIDAAHNEQKTDKNEDKAESMKSPGNDTMDMEAMAKLVEEMQAETEQGRSKHQDDAVTLEKAVPTNSESDVEAASSTDVTSVFKSAEMGLPICIVTPPLESGSGPDEATCNGENKSSNDEKKESEEKGENKSKGQEENKERNEKKGRKSQRQVCYYFTSGKKCYKGNKCHYSHDREVQDVETRESTQEFIKEEDFESYKDFVNEMTSHGKNINPKDLLYKMGYEKYNMETMGSVLIGQYKLAISKNNWHWVGQARYFAELFFPNNWIDENLPSKDGRKQKRGKDKPNQRKKSYNINEQYEGRRGMCQDVRLLENPNLTVISSNFGTKKDTVDDKSSQGIEEFVTDYTNGIIGEAVKAAAGETSRPDTVIRGAIRDAMNEGLSESIIMEVIDDVTNVDSSLLTARTPGKRGKVNKPDISRTPRRRPDELAVGFNYLADELIKHSPKTVDGGIICMDTLPPSKEVPEQLAFGFNYHADKLVKESPKSEKGEILIPGVVLTPGRKTRDQLAVGFNYHSNVIAKESPKLCDTENKPVHQGSKKRLYKVNASPDENKDINGKIEIDHTGDAGVKSKKVQKDRIAVGFSKNAELIANADKVVLNVLGEKDMNLSTEHANNLGTLSDEERNNSELDDSFIPTMVPTMLPAGSVW